MKINYKIGKILVLLGVATLFYGCTTSSPPMQYKKLPHKFTQTADGHIIKQHTIDIPISANIVVLLKDGKKDGYRRYYDIKDGKIIREEIFKNDVLHGSITTYYKSGKIEKITPYKNGKKDGVYKYFDVNGDLLHKKTYEDGYDSQGEEVSYSNGYLQHIRNYKNGKRDGRSREWFIKSDILESDTMYKNGVKHGTQKVYTEDRSLKYVVKYEYGKIVGDFKQYYKNGKLEYVVSYRYGSIRSVVKYLQNSEKEEVNIFTNRILMIDDKGVEVYAK